LDWGGGNLHHRGRSANYHLDLRTLGAGSRQRVSTAASRLITCPMRYLYKTVEDNSPVSTGRHSLHGATTEYILRTGKRHIRVPATTDHLRLTTYHVVMRVRSSTQYPYSVHIAGYACIAGTLLPTYAVEHCSKTIGVGAIHIRTHAQSWMSVCDSPTPLLDPSSPQGLTTPAETFFLLTPICPARFTRICICSL
jgi:hypothetical protein